MAVSTEATVKQQQFGVPGMEFSPGDHVCAVYLGTAERDEFMLPFLRSGLASGDKVICVVNAPDRAELATILGTSGPVEEYLESQQLEIQDSSETYLSSGRFEPSEMLSYWDRTMGGVIAGGQYAFARAVGEMPVPLRNREGIDSFVAYESELNRLMPRYPQVIVCMYDLLVYGGGIVVDLLRTHPKILLGGMVLDNPHYLAPEDDRR